MTIPGVMDNPIEVYGFRLRNDEVFRDRVREAIEERLPRDLVQRIANDEPFVDALIANFAAETDDESLNLYLKALADTLRCFNRLQYHDPNSAKPDTDDERAAACTTQAPARTTRAPSGD